MPPKWGLIDFRVAWCKEHPDGFWLMPKGGEHSAWSKQPAYTCMGIQPGARPFRHRFFRNCHRVEVVVSRGCKGRYPIQILSNFCGRVAGANRSPRQTGTPVADGVNRAYSGSTISGIELTADSAVVRRCPVLARVADQELSFVQMRITPQPRFDPAYLAGVVDGPA